jgi:hypothetical protein
MLVLAWLAIFAAFALFLAYVPEPGADAFDAASQLIDYDRQVERAGLHERTGDHGTAAIFHEAAARRAAVMARVSAEPGVWLARSLGHRESAARLRSLHVPSTIPMLSGSSVNPKGW